MPWPADGLLRKFKEAGPCIDETGHARCNGNFDRSRIKLLLAPVGNIVDVIDAKPEETVDGAFGGLLVASDHQRPLPAGNAHDLFQVVAGDGPDRGDYRRIGEKTGRLRGQKRTGNQDDIRRNAQDIRVVDRHIVNTNLVSDDLAHDPHEMGVHFGVKRQYQKALFHRHPFSFLFRPILGSLNYQNKIPKNLKIVKTTIPRLISLI